MYGGYKLFLGEDRLEVVRVNCGIANIPPFRINIPLFSKSIWFDAKMTRTEPNDKIELRKVLRPLHLPPDQHLGSRKILKVFMIHNNVNRISWTFQVVLPNLESFKNDKQFLVMCVIIQLCCNESAGVKSNQMNFIIFINNGENCSKSIVQSTSFHNELCIRNPMSKNGCGCECLFERVESITTGKVEFPRNILSGKTCQWNDNVQIIEDKPAIEISKT